VVLFELLSGEKPFTGDDMASLMYKISRERHPSIRTANPKVPQVMDKIIDRALTKELAKRYQKAGQMAEHLRSLIQRIDEIKAKQEAANK
jgi:serine/threonine-protein kinase